MNCLELSITFKKNYENTTSIIILLLLNNQSKLRVRKKDDRLESLYR